jgi:hypothetical protein
MTTAIIITFCTLLLLAYFFDLTSTKTRIPSVMLLLLLGWSLHQITNLLGLSIPDFTNILPVLGTVGLILIVLEGSLELELNATKMAVIRKSAYGAFFSVALLGVAIAFAFSLATSYSFKDCLTNAIPFCIISSAIAIPTARNLVSEEKEFIIYESSLSDILGVVAFNFVALNEIIDGNAFAHFGFQIVLVTIISFAATIGLSLMLNRIRQHVKFIPIILTMILIYALTKLFHLPGLIFILLFGLFIGNLEEFRKIKWIERLKPDELKKEVDKFRELVAEGTFLVRSLFFLLFGYLLESAEILQVDSLFWAIGIVAGALAVRFVQLKLSKLPVRRLIFVFPRGLISILLYISILPAQKIPLVNNALLTQVIILSALVMMVGLMSSGSNPATEKAPKP